MITVPTVELVEGLKEITPFAAPDKDSYWHGVLIEWDGGHLRFAAYDTLSGAEVTYTPGEGAEADATDEQMEALPRFGDQSDRVGGTEPWRVFISVPHAKEIVKTFSLPAKHALVPVSVKATPTGASLIVERSRDTGQSQHMGMWPNDPDRADKFPSIVAIVEAAKPASSSSEQFSPYRLGLLGAAARHGVLVLRIGADGHPAIALVEGRFVGFLYPVGSRPQTEVSA